MAGRNLNPVLLKWWLSIWQLISHSRFACFCHFQCFWWCMQPYLGPFSAILDPKVPFLGWIACSRALAVVSVPPCVKWAWLAVCGSPKPGVAASGCQRAVFLRLARIRALKLCLKTLKIARILIQQLIS